MSQMVRDLAQLLVLFHDNITQDITAQDARDLIVTFFGFPQARPPGPNDDNIDSSGVGAFFDTGNLWFDTAAKQWHRCVTGTPGAAVWRGLMNEAIKARITGSRGALTNNTVTGISCVVTTGQITVDLVNLADGERLWAEMRVGPSSVFAAGTYIMSMDRGTGQLVMSTPSLGTGTAALDFTPVGYPWVQQRIDPVTSVPSDDPAGIVATLLDNPVVERNNLGTVVGGPYVEIFCRTPGAAFPTWEFWTSPQITVPPATVVDAGANVVVTVLGNVYTVAVPSFPAADITGMLAAAQVGSGYPPGDLGSGTLPEGVVVDVANIAAGTLPVGVLIPYSQITSPPAPGAGQLLKHNTYVTTVAYATAITLSDPLCLHGEIKIKNSSGALIQWRAVQTNVLGAVGVTANTNIFGGQEATFYLDSPNAFAGSIDAPYLQVVLEVSGVGTAGNTLEIYSALIGGPTVVP